MESVQSSKNGREIRPLRGEIAVGKQPLKVSYNLSTE
jgi:hypothetical protein